VIVGVITGSVSVGEGSGVISSSGGVGVTSIMGVGVTSGVISNVGVRVMVGVQMISISSVGVEETSPI
jgi:hypothetical protein